MPAERSRNECPQPTEEVLRGQRVRAAAQWVVPLAAGLLSFAWGLRNGLPLPLGGDELLVIRRALAFGSGDLNPHWFVWGSFPLYVHFAAYSVVYALGWVLGHWSSPHAFAVAYTADPTTVTLTARWLSVAFALGAVEVTRRMTRDVAGSVAGVAAALGMALYPTVVSLAHYARPDTCSLLLIALQWWVLLRLFRSPGSWRLHALFGVVTGLSLATKVTAITVALAYPLVIAASPVRLPFRTMAKYVGLGAAVALLACFAGWPYAFLDFAAARSDLIDFQGSINVAGHVGPFAVLRRILQHVAGAPGWSLAGAGLMGVGVWMAARKMGRRGVVWCVPIGLTLAILLVQGRFQDNWLIPLAPVLCACFGMGAAQVQDWLRGPGRSVWRHAGALLLTGVVLVPMGVECARQDREFAGPHTASVAVRRIEAEIPAGSGMLLDTELLDVRPSLAAVERWIDIMRRERGGRRHRHVGAYLALQREVAQRVDRPTYDVYSVRHPWWLKTEEAAAEIRGETPTAPYHEKLGQRTVEDYRSLGVCYLIVDSDVLRRYDTDRYPREHAFYRAFRAQADLQTEVSPTPRLYGPSFQVWRLRGQPPGLAARAAR